MRLVSDSKKKWNRQDLFLFCLRYPKGVLKSALDATMMTNNPAFRESPAVWLQKGQNRFQKSDFFLTKTHAYATTIGYMIAAAAALDATAVMMFVTKSVIRVQKSCKKKNFLTNAQKLNIRAWRESDCKRISKQLADSTVCHGSSKRKRIRNPFFFVKQNE